MAKILRTSLCITVAVLCVNFSQQSSDLSKEKPAVNFRGTLQDFSGTEVPVENILIGGNYKNIPMYIEPATIDVSPEANTLLIDLHELQELRPACAEPSKCVVTYNNREYIKLMAISKGGKKESQYIIELSRKITCDEPNEAGPIERNISFRALKSLKIESYTFREEPSKTKAAEAKQDKQTYQCTQASKALTDLEAQTAKASGENKNALTSAMEAVKNWVGGICGTGK